MKAFKADYDPVVRVCYWLRLIVLMLLLILISILGMYKANATWTPPPGYVPSPAVHAWFQAHQWCCLQAERVKVKFRVSDDGWQYWMPELKMWVSINPEYTTVYPQGVVPPPNDKHPASFWDDLKFKQLQAEGVLFISGGYPMCFFPPKPSM